MRTTVAIAALLIAAVPLASATTLESPVQLHDSPLHIAPDVIAARVGDTLKLSVVNQGAAPHNLVVCGDAACSPPLARTANLDAGASTELSFAVPGGGEVEYYCDLPGHKAGGMRGVLQVEGAAAKESPGFILIGTLMSLAVVALTLRRS